MAIYGFELVGYSPIIFNNDNIAWGERVKDFIKDPANKDVSGTKGDDRCPAWGWLGRLYEDGERIAFPADNLMAALRKAGGEVKVGARKSAKSLSQSAIFIEEEYLTFTYGGRAEPTPMKAFRGLDDNLDFAAHRKAAEKAGFELFMKRVKPAGKTAGRHIRIRPRFRDWKLAGELEVTDPKAMTPELLGTLFEIAGRTVGIGDWRPGASTPGRYGMFQAQVKRAK